MERGCFDWCKCGHFHLLSGEIIIVTIMNVTVQNYTSITSIVLIYPNDCLCWRMSHNHFAIFALTLSASPRTSPLNRFRIRCNLLTSSRHLGLHGSFLAMHMLCKSIQAIMTYFMCLSLHSVFL